MELGGRPRDPNGSSDGRVTADDRTTLRRQPSRSSVFPSSTNSFACGGLSVVGCTSQSNRMRRNRPASDPLDPPIETDDDGNGNGHRLSFCDSVGRRFRADRRHQPNGQAADLTNIRRVGAICCTKTVTSSSAAELAESADVVS